MTLLEKVKEDYAKEQGCSDWNNFIVVHGRYESITDKIAERYAQELTKAKLTEVRYKINDSPRDTIDMPGCKIAVRIIDKTIREL